jgi:hypothetical protein
MREASGRGESKLRFENRRSLLARKDENVRDVNWFNSLQEELSDTKLRYHILVIQMVY